MLNCILAAAIAASSLLSHSVVAAPQVGAGNVLAYAGGKGNVRFNCIYALKEGTVLIGGGADNLDWLPAAAKRVNLSGIPAGGSGGRTAFILVGKPDFSEISAVIVLPADSAKNVRWIKSSNVPGAATGDIFISGENVGGYFLAKLDGNFTSAVPDKVKWSYQVKAKKDIAEKQPWDVGSDGRVVFASGEAHSPDWADVQRLDPDGQPGVVEHWRNHWTATGGDWQGTPASANPNGKSVRSAIVFKVAGRGSLRSWTQEDYSKQTSDGNGGTKQGRWPWDYYFSGPFNPGDPGSSPGGPGYTGYKWGRNPVGHPQAIAVDRRNNDIYIGGNNQSKLPDGNPDFEPFVISFNAEGKQKWWQRLYAETPQNSTPDQYVDGLTIDYADKEGALVVLARCHGNNVVNLWNGNKIKHAGNPGTAFQNSFTGKSGNIHISWLGRLGLVDGTMLHATYVAEWADAAKVGTKPVADPNLDGWPSPNDGWPDVNTTRCQPSLHVDGLGNIYVIGTGRRVITTANAHQKVPKIGQGESKWADFVRVYDRELKTLKYSSLVTGLWDPAVKGSPTSDVKVEGIFPIAGGVVLAGHAPLAKDGSVQPGPDMPVANPPAWAAKSRTGEMGVFGVLRFAQ